MKLFRILFFAFCLFTVSAHAADDSPLFEAVKNGDKVEVEAMLAKGADVNAKDKEGVTPLHRAAYQGLTDIVELLLAKGADVNARRAEGDTPLHWAALDGKADVADLLIARGANVRAKGPFEETPLHKAAYYAPRRFVELLLIKGADVNARNEFGHTPLSKAAYAGKKDIVELLLAKGADVNATDKRGMTSLHGAASEGKKDVAELLLAKGADINAKDEERNTPLHTAANRGKKDIVEFLIAKGADVTAKNKDGRTPLELANFAEFSGSTYEPVWTRNIRRAEELREQADVLAKAGDKPGSWRALSEAIQLSPDDPLLLRDFCHSSFDAGRYRDVVWSARKMVEDWGAGNKWLFGGASMQYEWGISLAVLGEYEQSAQIFREGLKRFPSEEWGDGFREWSIVLTYLNEDFGAAREEARSHPVKALGGTVLNGSALNGAVWNLLKNRIDNLSGMAETHKMQYPLLQHLSQLHRLLRDGIERGYLSSETPEWKAKIGAISRDLAWRTISIYRSLPVKPLPPPGATEMARRALNVIATEPERVHWERAISDLMDVTRRVPWWAEAHYNLAVLFEDKTAGGNWGLYYDYGDLVQNRTIAAQEYMFSVGADPRGSKAAAARKMLNQWKQPIPN